MYCIFSRLGSFLKSIRPTFFWFTLGSHCHYFWIWFHYKKLLKIMSSLEYSRSAVTISADFAAVRFIFLDKIHLVYYEKFATMRIFLWNSSLQLSCEFFTVLCGFLKRILLCSEFYTAHNKNRLVRFFRTVRYCLRLQQRG